MVLVEFDNFPNCFLNILIFDTLGDIFWFYSTTFSNNINITFTENLCKHSFAIVISWFPNNPLFVRNDPSCNVAEARFYVFSS